MSDFWKLMTKATWVFIGIMTVLLSLFYVGLAVITMKTSVWWGLAHYTLALIIGAEGVALIIIYTKKAMEVLGCGSSKE